MQKVVTADTKLQRRNKMSDTLKLQEAADDGCPPATCSRLLPPPMQTAMVFAARYTHHRNTGGTLAVCRALAWCWDQLDERTQKQILEESHEATSNLDNWAQFRGDDSSANA